jgi:GDP-4-dehydro-6-deoxy-D-mannose reductase
MSRVLVTGGGGFVGQWVARTFLARGDDVVLAGLGDPGDGPRILTADERASISWVATDVRSTSDVEAMVEAAHATTIVHLAGVAFPPDADRDPTSAYDVNTLGAVRLLAALARRRAEGKEPTVLIVGTAFQYGRHDEAEQPLTEAAEQRPTSVYGASKAAQEIAALQIARDRGLRVVCTRSFNHSGPGQTGAYLLPSLVQRVAAMRAGDALRLGNDALRDYLHVADVADAYVALCERGRSGEVYNVASGVGVSVRQLAHDVLLRAGVRADISTDPSLVRATDIPVLVGSPAKLTRDTGWTPRRTHADIIEDLLRFANAASH